MSDFTAVILLMAIFVAALATAALLARNMYGRADDVLSGTVNGVPIPLESRWRSFVHDYVGHSFAITMLGGVTADGFYVAGQALGESRAAVVAYLCALVGSGFLLSNVTLGLIWMRHFAAVLRKAAADCRIGVWRPAQHFLQYSRSALCKGSSTALTIDGCEVDMTRWSVPL